MSMRIGLVASLLAAVIATGCSDSDDAPAVGDAPVATSTGTYQGVPSTTPTVTMFRGIRYGTAPMGNLRWTPPQAPTGTSTATVTANTFGADCIQLARPSATQSEDCLFLNVYAPSGTKTDDSLPVMVWIHGGGFITGSGAGADPTALVAEGNIIVVTINYRLGAFGYLDHAALAATVADDFQNVGDAGNYGLMDQQFALRWVKNNIARFGGSPEKVTVAGESAGAMSIEALIAAPSMNNGLFRAAIMQSGGVAYDTFPKVGDQRALFSATFDATIGCTSPATAACLRGQSVAQVVAAHNATLGHYNSYPLYGTKSLPIAVKSAIQSGNYVKVPVIAGGNQDEGRFFIANQVTVPTADRSESIAMGGPLDYYLNVPSAMCGTTTTPATCTYGQGLQNFMGAFNSYFVLIAPATTTLTGFGDQLANLYPMNSYPNRYVNNAPNASLGISRVFTDAYFACKVFSIRHDLSISTSVYGYEFDDQDQPTYPGPAIQAPNNVVGYSSGSQHTQDLPYLFDSGAYSASLSPSEQQLGQVMRRYWSNFARNLDPNSAAGAPNGVAIPAFPGYPSVQKLTPGHVAAFSTFGSDHQCTTFWGPLWGH